MPRLARPAILAAALLGGICWVAHVFIDVAALTWVGSGLLLVAAGLVGAGLSRLPWLAVVSGIGAAALWWCLVDLVRGVASDRVVEGVLGATVALAVGLAVLTPTRGATPVRRSSPQLQPRHASCAPRGNHRG